MILLYINMVFSGSSDGYKSARSAGDLGLIPGLGRSSGEGNGNPLQYFCLENSMDRPWGRKESNMTEWLAHFIGIHVSPPSWTALPPASSP